MNARAKFCSVAANPSRSLVSRGGPFRVVPGRGIVDANGNVIAQACARRALTPDGEAFERWEDGIAPAEADGNAHALAVMMNAAAHVVALADALNAYRRTIKYLQRTTNAEEWETHGNWAGLETLALAALAPFETLRGESSQPGRDTTEASE